MGAHGGDTTEEQRAYRETSVREHGNLRFLIDDMMVSRSGFSDPVHQRMHAQADRPPVQCFPGGSGASKSLPRPRLPRWRSITLVAFQISSAPVMQMMLAQM